MGLQPLTDQAELIVSELVTNAVHASEALNASRYAGRWAPGKPPVRLWLHAHQQRIAVQVWATHRHTVQPLAWLAAVGLSAV